MEKALLREPDIKAALIDRIEERGLLSDAALINEMVVANWSRRVDLAVANGNLHAYEIKSDFDSLKRLDGQLDSYIARFDKVTVVCSSKFTTEVLERTPPSVEVLEVFHQDEGVEFRVARRGQLRPIRDKGVLLAFLLKAELLELLKRNSVAVGGTPTRKTLEAMAMTLPLATIRAYVLESLKARYWETSEAFITSRRHRRVTRTKIEDLDKLSRAKLQLRAQRSVKQSSQGVMPPCSMDEARIAVDWDQISARHGQLPGEMPGYVLRRRVAGR